MEKPRRGLIVREPYASLIVDGKKTWEIRKHPTRIRGPIGIVTGGKLIGQAEIVEVRGPFSPEELLAYRDRHHADPEFLFRYANGKPLWAWVLENPVRYKEPLPVPRRKGRMLWVDLSELWQNAPPAREREG